MRKRTLGKCKVNVASDEIVLNTVLLTTKKKELKVIALLIGMAARLSSERVIDFDNIAFFYLTQ